MQTLAFVLGLGAGFEEVQAVPSEQVLALAVNPNPYGIG